MNDDEDENRQRDAGTAGTPRRQTRAGVLWRAFSVLVARATGARRRSRRGVPGLHRHELSVVACDLRGYTHFSASVPPDEVVDLLREHYRRIGEIVATFRGVIKDHAGDGTLVLVGAARPSEDHADRAVAMAFAIAARADEVLLRWRRDGIEIGLGIGVASGEVTVGSIEAGSRVEPVAVGAAVNLAARLCARARPGQILVDERTVALAQGEKIGRLQRLEIAELKGFATPVPIFQAVAR
jgi:class 3 adenylate cyclase